MEYLEQLFHPSIVSSSLVIAANKLSTAKWCTSIPPYPMPDAHTLPNIFVHTLCSHSLDQGVYLLQAVERELHELPCRSPTHSMVIPTTHGWVSPLLHPSSPAHYRAVCSAS